MLGQCLERLAPGRQTLAAACYEVIVTDDGQHDGAEAFCKAHYPFVRYTRGPRKGPAANRNNGARMAAGGWLVFTDDDCLPEPGWLQAYAHALQQHPTAQALEGAILPDDRKLLQKDMAECPVNEHGGCFWSANIAVERALFYQIGQFDEKFTIAAMEDKDIYNRLQRYTDPVFVREAKVVHPVRFISLRVKIKNYPKSWENYHKYLATLPQAESKARRKKSMFNHAYSVYLDLKAFRCKKAVYHTYALFYYMYKSITNSI